MFQNVGAGTIVVGLGKIWFDRNYCGPIRNRLIDRTPFKIGDRPAVVSFSIDRIELYCSGAVCNGLIVEAFFDMGIAAPCIRLLIVWIGFYCFGAIQNDFIVRFVLSALSAFWR